MLSRVSVVFVMLGAMTGCGSATVSPTPDGGVMGDLPAYDVPADRPVDAPPDTSRPPRVPLRHRASATACTSVRPPSRCDIGMASGPPVECRADSECTMGVNGRCVGNPHDGCRCNYDRCTTDSECSTGGPCECRLASRGAAGANVCLAGNCRVDADCGAGGYCSPTLGSCGDYGGLVGYYCHTANDECVDDSDCNNVDAGFLGQRPYCMYAREAGRWVCSNMGCAG